MLARIQLRRDIVRLGARRMILQHAGHHLLCLGDVTRPGRFVDLRQRGVRGREHRAGQSDRKDRDQRESGVPEHGSLVA